ncbi:MAG: DUF1622 domain-containing protein [Candidatus Krumholzibacteriota bacterium]|nr:DUF1622 domain-containing protein [Candidatus Krumholzibacteriota bacterium]
MKILHTAAEIIGIAGIAVIVWGVAVTFARFVAYDLSHLRGRGQRKKREALRHQLGSYLLLGLEFLIAADVVNTVNNPTLEGMALLAAIVAIRTAISYFVDKEMAYWHPSHDAEEDPGAPPTTAR